MKHIKNLAIVLAFVFLGGCNSDDVDNAPERGIVVTTLDVNATVKDNAVNGDLIGKVKGRTNNGQVSFAIVSETPEGAITIDEISGELFILDETLIDGATAPEINLSVSITNGAISQTSTVIITVLPDADGDGVFSDEDPDDNSPCFPVQNAGYIDFDVTNAIWMAADCDDDGTSNIDEVRNGSDPYSTACNSTVNTSIWNGNFTRTERGFVSESSAPAIAGCGTLIIPDPVGYGPCTGDAFEILLTLTPSTNGATSGTVEALVQPYVCGFHDGTYSATGTYDEATQTITLNYTTDGFGFPFPGTTVITPRP